MSDDELITRIRERAWDPARRLRTVGVPLGFVLDHTDDPQTGRAVACPAATQHVRRLGGC